VRLQKLDSGDRLTEVVLVPPAPEDEEIAEGSVDASTSPDTTAVPDPTPNA
jgi:DNA gyrase subunit A